jgi:peptide/nickel transport system substrate-binding protein
MTADDVVFSFERQYNPDHWYHDKGEWAYWGYMFTDIEFVEKIDTYTVAIHMKRPNASIMTSLAMFTMCIVSEKAAEEYGDDYFKNPVGTGPFEFVDWVKDDQIELRAFQDYWRDPASIKTLIFKVITDPSARLMALQTGEVHGIEHVDPKQLDIIRDDPELQLVSQAGMNVGYIALNCGEGYEDANNNGKWDAGEEVDVPGVFEPFLDVNVRRAIAHAINKDSIVRNLYQGAATAAVEGMPPVLFGYNDNIKGYEYNVDKAKQLLADAGYPDGFEVELWHVPVSRPYFPVPTEIAEAIQSDLAKIGITVTLFTEDWGTYLQDTEAGKHQMAMLGWTGDNGDPDNFLNVLYSQDKAVVGAAGNIAFKKNQKFQDLLDEALVTFDQSERADLYEKANELLVEQCSHIFIAHADQNLGFRASVRGYIIHPTSRKFFYPVWLEDAGGLTEKEIEALEYEAEAEDLENEARNYEDAGELEKAAKTWEKAAKKREKAAEIWGNPVNLDRSMRNWRFSGIDWSNGAENWEILEEWGDAADAWRNAVKAFAAAGEEEAAAKAQENQKRAEELESHLCCYATVILLVVALLVVFGAMSKY